MAFYVGQKVALIDDSEWTAADRLAWSYPEKGVIYTVREVLLPASGDLALRLVEIRNRVGRCVVTGDECEPRFLASRFRPAVEPNIQQFRDLVAPIFNRNRERESV